MSRVLLVSFAGVLALGASTFGFLLARLVKRRGHWLIAAILAIVAGVADLALASLAWLGRMQPPNTTTSLALFAGSCIFLVGGYRAWRDTRESLSRQERLARSESRLRLLLEGIPSPMWTWVRRGDAFVLESVNDAAQKMTAGRAEEYVGQRADQVWRDREDLRHLLSECLRKREVLHFETEYQPRSGGTSARELFTFVPGPPDSVLLIAQDFTAFRAVEHHLRLVEHIVDQSSLAVGWAEIFGRMIYANPRM